MDGHEQVEFVLSLANLVTKRLVADIEEGRVPEEWGGKQLRKLIAQRFASQEARMTPGEIKEFNNDCAIHNL